MFRSFSTAVCGLLVVCAAGLCHAQIPFPGRMNFDLRRGPVGIQSEGPVSQVQVRRTLFPSNRVRSRAIEQAQRMLEAGRYSEALPLLQGIIDDTERSADAFFGETQSENSSSTTLSGTKAMAHRLIESLPPDGREAYERRYGSQAATELKDALVTGDVVAIDGIGRRYWMTAAGRDATRFMAMYYFERGQALESATRFDAITDGRPDPPTHVVLMRAAAWMKAGFADNAVDILTEFRERSPATVTLGDRQLEVFADQADAIPWLNKALQLPAAKDVAATDWRMVRGNAQRNGRGGPATSVWHAIWERSAFDVSGVVDGVMRVRLKQAEESVAGIAADRRTNGLMMFPPGSPLVLGNLVISRSLGSIRAHDLRSGELMWESALLDRTFRSAMQPVQKSVRSVELSRSTTPLFLEERLFQDLSSGTLSSDGRHVFAVEDNPLPTVETRFRVRGQVPVVAHNVLRAYDARTGFVRWEIGGPRLNQFDSLEQPPAPFDQTRFLGPPLSLGDRLYVLAERDGNISLLALRTIRFASGLEAVETDWSIVLAHSPANNHRRGTMGLTPSYARGVLVCPTSTGAVVGVSLRQRMLLWGYRYRSPSAPLMAGMQRTTRIVADQDRWMDSPSLIAGNRVLVTPGDSYEMHCIDISTGELQWKRPRGQMLYAAAVHDDVVVMVGRGRIESFAMADGSRQWQSGFRVDLPAGRALYSGGLLHVPTVTGDVISMNPSNGRQVVRTHAVAETLGNLVSADGMIVSQTPTALLAFPAVDIAVASLEKRLVEKPLDEQANLQLAAARFQQGQPVAARKLLRQAIARDASGPAREMLIEDLMEGLRVDFDGNRDNMSQIRRLIDTRGLQCGDLLHSLLHAYPWTIDAMNTMIEQYQIVTARLQPLWRLEAEGLLKTGDWQAALRNTTRVVADLGSADAPAAGTTTDNRTATWMLTGLRELYDRLAPRERSVFADDVTDVMQSLAAEAKLVPFRQWLRHFGDQPWIRADMVIDFPRLEPLQREQLLLSFESLAKQHGVQAELNGELAELYDRHGALHAGARRQQRMLPADDQAAVTEWQQYIDPWKDVPLVARDTGRMGGRFAHRKMVRLSADGEFSDWMFRMETSTYHLHALDPLGAKRWYANLSRHMARVRTEYSVVSSSGHLLILNAFGRLFALDALDVANGTARVLWQKRIPSERTAPLVYLSTPLEFVYREDRAVVCIDPQTGDELWRRDNLPARFSVFGDSRFLIVQSMTSETSLVLRTADGKEVRYVSLPVGSPKSVALTLMMTRREVLGPQPLTTLDRILVVQHRTRDSNRIEAIDGADGIVLWNRELPVETLRSRAVDGLLALALPNGQVEVVDLRSGRSIASTQADPKRRLQAVKLAASRHRVLVLFEEASDLQPRSRFTISRSSVGRYVNGQVLAFDRHSGDVLWKQRREGETLYTNYSFELPILLFQKQRASERPLQLNRSAPILLSRFDADIVDARSGAVLARQKDVGASTVLAVGTGDEPGTIRVEFQKQAVLLGPPVAPPDGTNDDKENDKAAPPDSEKAKPESAEQSGAEQKTPVESEGSDE